MGRGGRAGRLWPHTRGRVETDGGALGLGRHRALLRTPASSDLQLDYSLTDDFCRNHFLAGLLLREVGAALQELREVRAIAVGTLKNLLIKHSFDDRYASRVSAPEACQDTARPPPRR